MEVGSWEKGKFGHSHSLLLLGASQRVPLPPYLSGFQRGTAQTLMAWTYQPPDYEKQILVLYTFPKLKHSVTVAQSELKAGNPAPEDTTSAPCSWGLLILKENCPKGLLQSCASLLSKTERVPLQKPRDK